MASDALDGDSVLVFDVLNGDGDGVFDSDGLLDVLDGDGTRDAFNGFDGDGVLVFHQLRCT